MDHSEQTADSAAHQQPDRAEPAQPAEPEQLAAASQPEEPAQHAEPVQHAEAPAASATAPANGVPAEGTASAYVPPPEQPSQPGSDPVAANAASFGEPVAASEPVRAEAVSEQPAQVEWRPEQPLQAEAADVPEAQAPEAARPEPEAAPVQPEAAAPSTVEPPASTEVQATTEAPTSTEAAATPEAPVAPQASATEAPSAEASSAAVAPATTEAPAVAEATAADAGAGEAPAASAAPQQPKPPDERRIRAQQAWERVVAARESGETLNGTVTAAVKGGLLVDVGGIRGFLPASQTRVEAGTPIEAMVKAKLPLKVIDVDTGRRRIVVSHRRALQDERRSKRTELLRSLAIGQVREGVVVRIAEFGAFVDLGGIDGLIPMRELAFERIDKASDVVKIGEKLPVEVIRIEEGGKKIALSRKNALPDPWRDHAAVLKQGGTVEGKVVAKDPRLQVEIAPGVVGSVRENDANPADYEIGEAIEVVVRRVDRATRRITLSTTNAVPDVPQQQQTSTGFAPLGIELGRRK
jgi:small subunit ribosomal protein S1